MRKSEKILFSYSEGFNYLFSLGNPKELFTPHSREVAYLYQKNYKLSVPNAFMHLQKQFSKKLVIKNTPIEKLGWKGGEALEAKVKGKKLIIERN